MSSEDDLAVMRSLGWEAEGQILPSTDPFQLELSPTFYPLIAQYVKEISSSSGTQVVDSGDPHDALFFALQYLDVKDLLSVELVCKSLSSAVRDDPLLWRCIHIGADLSWSSKLSDDILFRLTQRAQGNLQCLSLFHCNQITDEGLKAVLMCNPRLKRLHLCSCFSVTTEALIDTLKDFNNPSMSRIKQLKLENLHMQVSEEQYKELRSLVGGDKQSKPKNKFFFHNWLKASPHCCDDNDDDERAISIELCPRCQKFKLVFDCPSDDSHCLYNPCRGCFDCIVIVRCVHCGEELDRRMRASNYTILKPKHICSYCYLHYYIGLEANHICDDYH